MSIRQWTTKFITKILQITHAQWIHRNSSLHQKEGRYLDLQLKNKSALEIIKYLDADPREIPAESQHLMEVDPNEILGASHDHQTYWLLAMKAATKAGRRVAGRGRRQGTGKRATEGRRRWNRKMTAQLTLGTKEIEQEARRWERAITQKVTKRRSRAGESAALKSNKRCKYSD